MGRNKNNPSNRNQEKFKRCTDCDDPLKWLLLSVRGKNKMVTECKCGYKNRSGIKV